MAKNDVIVTDNPKLKQKKLTGGKIALYLEYYYGYDKVADDMSGEYKIKANRRKETLKGLCLIENPRTPLERQTNKEVLQLAAKIRDERAQQFLEQGEGYRLKRDRDINFLDYFQTYMDKYNKKDGRMLKLALQRFKDFLRDTDEYKRYEKSIKPERLDKDMMVAFTEYLQSRSRGEGALGIYQRFKKVIKYAQEHGVIHKNPCEGVRILIDDQVLRKDVLSFEEERALIATHYYGENPEIRRAFILSLYCGLRFCDVKDLTFANVDYSNKILKFEQNKTKGHSKNSGVVIPLSDSVLRLIGEPSEGQTKDSHIFTLPTYEACSKALKRWIARAGIDKHITWHCARHSFAVNILNNGANIKTVASLLGHSGLKHTEKYTRAIDELKQKAIDSLPSFDIANI